MSTIEIANGLLFFLYDASVKISVVAVIVAFDMLK